MRYALFQKEIKDFFKSKTTLLFFILLLLLISYSFYTAVDLYSKASLAAIDDPLYAAGFEPVQGVFVPSFGGFFIIISLLAPFLFIQSIGSEKKHKTLPLLAQLPCPLYSIFLIKFAAGVILLLISIIVSALVVFLWYIPGGHLPLQELFLLLFGYFLYGLFIISISFFSAALFNSNAQASIFALSLIMLSWFVDFGKDMNIISVFSGLSSWTVTRQLKKFEDGIFSFSSTGFFLLLSSYFLSIAYLFFDFTQRKKLKLTATITVIFLALFAINTNIHFNFDLTESKRNSFSSEANQFLKKIPPVKIDIFLEAGDSRAIDYKKDFLKKLTLVKPDVKINYMSDKLLSENYGSFRYTINKKSEETFSNSEEEIFMILEGLSGLKIKRSTINESFCGYPLVVNRHWSIYLFLLYIVILPIIILFVYLKSNFNKEFSWKE